jgi:hypothetical protein
MDFASLFVWWIILDVVILVLGKCSKGAIWTAIILTVIAMAICSK